MLYSHAIPEAFFEGKNISFYGPQGWKLSARVWEVQNPIATVFGVHGYSEYSRRYAHMAAYFNDQHFNFVMVDLPGHGLSEGPRSNIDDFEDYLKSIDAFLNETKGYASDKNFWFAHSLGGLISTRFFQTRQNLPIKISKLALSGPLFGIYQTPKLLLSLAEGISKIMPNLYFANDGKLGVGALTLDKDMQKSREADPLVKAIVTLHWIKESSVAMKKALADASRLTIPFKIFQGEDELVTDRHAAKKFFDHVPDSFSKEFKIYPNFRHELANEIKREIFFKDLVDFFSKTL